MREPQDFRHTLEWLTEQTNGKGWLTTTQIARLLGVTRQTVNNRFGIHSWCALPVLAKKLCEESNK